MGTHESRSLLCHVQKLHRAWTPIPSASPVLKFLFLAIMVICGPHTAWRNPYERRPGFCLLSASKTSSLRGFCWRDWWRLRVPDDFNALVWLSASTRSLFRGFCVWALYDNDNESSEKAIVGDLIFQIRAGFCPAEAFHDPNSAKIIEKATRELAPHESRSLPRTYTIDLPCRNILGSSMICGTMDFQCSPLTVDVNSYERRPFFRLLVFLSWLLVDLPFDFNDVLLPGLLHL
jgi:hypothetical protein